MTREATRMCGVILITVPTIQYGGYFLLTSLIDPCKVGHAHAGVLVILALICQLLADSAALPGPLLWLARIGTPAAAILMPLGFFLCMPSPDAAEPNGLTSLIYIGAIVLVLSVLTLGVGLLRSPAPGL
jgi:hypothetical protein